MMDILIQEARAKRDKLLEDILALEKEIKDINLPEAKEKNYKVLKEVLHKHQEYIKDKIIRKLKRDDGDYKSGRVFTYACKFDNIKLDRHEVSTHTPNEGATSITSTSKTALADSHVPDTCPVSNLTIKDKKDIQTPLSLEQTSGLSWPSNLDFIDPHGDS
ncbi:hypothetical protein NDU88_000340 [Pleurodeles waltl]|uniref:Uncharacterized protein n=1 Tax=Pleurodeles waltl TaxID=8319 RepID=A0AAV7UQ81_PLEWA|nr:hypothetical protein NDU88_000340 [Pleurodeles waltl]